MDTCISPPNRGVLSAAADGSAQPCIYSFRCSRGMEECISRIMSERGLNRTSVIRLALYALDSYLRRRELRELPLAELVEQLEGIAPETRMSFQDFMRGS